MYFSSSDIELLRLAGWCKNLPSEMAQRFHSQVFNSADILLLDQLKLLNTTKNGKSIRLREKGWRFLRYLGMDYHKDAAYMSGYDRRLEIAWILLTFWRAGFDVFESSVRNLKTPQGFIQSAAARRNASPGGDIWGGAVFWGLARLRNTIISCYHAGGHEDMKIHFRNEKDMLDKAAIMLETEAAMLYAGESYEQLARLLRNNSESEGKGGRKSFSEIYKMGASPIYLLECGDTGALQLMILSQENYRKRLAGVILGIPIHPEQLSASDRFAPPPIGVGDADGTLLAQGSSIPWLLAVDMDVVRIGRACRQSIAAGYETLIIICLPAQVKALKLLYGDNNVKIVVVTEENLLEAFGALRLYEPDPGPYHNMEGGMIDAAHLPVD